MAKNKSAETNGAAFKTGKTHPRTTVVETGKKMVRGTGGVVAYTKGSRFKDEEVLAVVQRVLRQS